VIRATGSIDCDSVGTGVLPTDGENFVLNDGTNPAVTFEFDTNGSVSESATLRQVDLTDLANDNQLALIIVRAVGNAPTLDIQASYGGLGVVDLVHLPGGSAANVTITTTVAAGDFVVTGMTGGTDQLTVDIVGPAGAAPGEDISAPFVTNENPARAATGVALNSNIAFDIRDNISGVSEPSIVVTIEGVVAYTGSAFVNSFTGTVTLFGFLDYSFDINPPADFPDNTTINVDITADDLSGNSLVDAYTFTTPGKVAAQFKLRKRAIERGIAEGVTGQEAVKFS